MSVVLNFFVEGNPRPKGSFMFSSRGKGRKAIVKPMNKIDGYWEKLIHAHALQAAGKAGYKVDDSSAFFVHTTFYMPRPKNHFGTGRNAGTIKAGYLDEAPVAEGSGDIDKLLRAVLDGLAGVIYKTDAQVCLTDTNKIYEFIGAAPGVWIETRPIKRANRGPRRVMYS